MVKIQEDVFGLRGGNGGGGGFLNNLRSGFGQGATSAYEPFSKGLGYGLGSTLGGSLGQFGNPNTATGSALLTAGLSKHLPNVPELPQSIQQLQQQGQ